MKFIAVITAAAMLICLAACAKNEPGTNIKAPETEASANVSTAPEAEGTSPTPEASAPETAAIEELTPVYDGTAIAEAYLSGDASGLDEKQSAIYEAAVEAINGFYSDSMTDEETVIAAHDWIVENISYDENMLLAIPKQSEDTENPYGALIKRQAICMGYTTTFQLFMDMLGIESKVVHGSAEDEEHAWNLVNIGGNWYHVDTTWDDFVPEEKDRPAFHLYCLVPDSVMKINHVWEKESFPSADFSDLIYYPSHGKYAENKAAASDILNEAYRNGMKFEEIMYDRVSDGFGGVSLDGVSFNKTAQYWLNDFGDYIVVVYWLL